MWDTWSFDDTERDILRAWARVHGVAATRGAEPLMHEAMTQVNVVLSEEYKAFLRVCVVDRAEYREVYA